MNKKTIFSIIVLLALIPVIYFAWTKFGAIFFGANNPQMQQNQNMGFGGNPEILALKIEEKEIVLYQEFPARVAAFRIAEIRPQISGIITKRNFEEGSEIKEKDQLYQIEEAQFLANQIAAKADLQKAEANLKAIKARYDRYQSLVKIDAISKQEFDDMKAEIAQAEADVAIKKSLLEKAEIDLKYSKVLAPISGKIGKSFVTEGALVSANQQQILATIVQLDPIYVNIVLSSADLVKIHEKIGDEKVDIELAINDQNKIYDKIGKLQFAESIVDESTGSVSLRAIFENPNQTLLPGLFVKARIKFKPQNLILVPQNATTRNPEGDLMVFVVDENNIANPRIIKSSQSFENFYIIDEGLKVGEIIVLEGFQKIAPKTQVKIVFNESK